MLPLLIRGATNTIATAQHYINVIMFLIALWQKIIWSLSNANLVGMIYESDSSLIVYFSKFHGVSVAVEKYVLSWASVPPSHRLQSSAAGGSPRSGDVGITIGEGRIGAGESSKSRGGRGTAHDVIHASPGGLKSLWDRAAVLDNLRYDVRRRQGSKRCAHFLLVVKYIVARADGDGAFQTGSQVHRRLEGRPQKDIKKKESVWG